MNKNYRLPLIALVFVLVTNAVFAIPVSAQQSCVEDMNFVSDISIPDGTNIQPGAQFTKTWRIKNTGTCTWSTSHVFRYVEGELMWANPEFIYMPSGIGSQNTIDVSVTFTAPNQAGTYKSYWQMKNPSGVAFGSKIWVQITVGAAFSNMTNGTIQQNATPMPKNFDFREISSNEVEIYFNNAWVKATKNPQDKYTLYNGVGAYTLYYYNHCETKWYWEGWSLKSRQECTLRSRQISDSGLGAAVEFSQEGAVQFYSYMRGLTFGAVGNVAGGTIQGLNGYRVYELGSASSAKIATLSKYVSRVGPMVIIPAFIIYAEKMWVVTYPIQPMPVATAPTMPRFLDYNEYDKLITTDLNVLLTIGRQHGSYKGVNYSVEWDFTLLKNSCDLFVRFDLPKYDGSRFASSFQHKDDNKGCSVEDVVKFIMSVGILAVQGNVILQFVSLVVRDLLHVVQRFDISEELRLAIGQYIEIMRLLQ